MTPLCSPSLSPSPHRYYLGIDLGTSSVKALLIDRFQRIVASADAPLSIQRPHDGWAEQDPSDWVEATRGGMSWEELNLFFREISLMRINYLSPTVHLFQIIVRNCLFSIPASLDAIDSLKRRAPLPLSALQGIGLSGQMHGAVLVDSDGVPLRPCILWNDTRAHREASEMNADERFRQMTGNMVYPGFTAPKMEWVRRNEPEVFARTAKVAQKSMENQSLTMTGELSFFSLE